MDEVVRRRSCRASFSLSGRIGLSLFFQRHILFHPSRERKAKEGFFLQTPAGRIRVEVRNPGKENALIYLPGNSEHWWEDPDDLARLLPEHTIYFPHYPGYGASEGAPSQQTLFDSADRLYDHIAPRHCRIDLVGRSLGSGVALHLAAHRPIRRLVLITPYDSIAALGAERYPLFPVRAIIRDPFDVFPLAKDVNVPTLILLAEHDSVIPHTHSRRLIRHFQKITPQVLTLPGTDHGNIVEAPEYPKILRSFLE